MELPPGKRLDPAEKPTGEQDLVVGTDLARQALRQFVDVSGAILAFAILTIRAIPGLRKFPAEVARQAAVLALSSGLIIWAMQFVIGAQCALQANYVLRQIGAPYYSGVFTAWCGLREMAPYMWGYILAAKVGCGLVAELGSMRISEEIDALEVMGVSSRSYLVASRIVAAWLVMPFLYFTGVGMMYIAEYLVVVVQFGEVSAGAYNYIFWLFQNPADFFYSVTKMMVIGTIIVFVGAYYGYTASGGSVGVGQATARSMMLNMVLIHVAGMLLTQLFWGGAPNAPVAN
ncbi:ABC transporter permease [Nitriliruptor alkaliphilus]|uniref:ABC transporter permease n=1 Tax=Nitriliruptor alkaliphilus TaxID=427918 RepID=UPI0009FABA1E|nr:ABC transporter permease [Nitriliruptor alkaliphilus]